MTHAERYPIRNISPSDYQAGIQNIDFTQNGGGALFIANNLGVLSYDGVRWALHEGVPGKKMRSLAYDASGRRLYVGAQGEFGYFEGEWEYVSLSDSLSAIDAAFDDVWEVYRRDDRVYFCTQQGIYSYDGHKVHLVRHPSGIEVTFELDRGIIVQAGDQRLYELVDDKLSPISLQPSVAHGMLAGVVSVGDGLLLIYQSGHIEQATLRSQHPAHDALSKMLEGTYVNRVLQLTDQRVAIATQTAGVFLYDFSDGTIEQLSASSGLRSDACLDVFQDYQGHLWLGLQSGMAVVDIHAPMRIVGPEIGLRGSGYDVLSVGETTYYATSSGLYFQPSSDADVHFMKGTEGPAYSLQRIEGQVYAGHHTGLFRLAGHEAIRVARTEGLWCLRTLQHHPGVVLGGTYRGLVRFSFDQKDLLQYEGPITGFEESSQSFEEDSDGQIIVSQYYKGLYRLRLSSSLEAVSVSRYATDMEAMSDQVVLSRVGDQLLVGTKEGIYEIQPSNDVVRRAAAFDPQIGRRPVYLIAQDAYNHIHVIAKDAIGYFEEISPHRYRYVPSSLSKMRYELNNDLLHLSIGVGQGVYIAAHQGFVHYDPTAERIHADHAPPTITRVRSLSGHTPFMRNPFEAADGSSLPDVSLSARDAGLVIDMTTYDYQYSAVVIMQYWMEGLEADYGDWTTMTTKEYAHLPPGSYTFHARVRHPDGSINTSEPLLIKVAPPFYRSLWAKICYGALALFGSFMIYRLWRRRQEKTQKQLEQRLNDVVVDSTQKIQALAAEKNQEIEALTDEKLQQELTHLNSQLAASTMNLVVKNEFIASLKDELQGIRQGGAKKATQQALEKIEREIDRTLRLEEDWEQFEHQFDRVHGDFLKRLRQDYTDLSPNEQRLCAFLRLNLNTKEIAQLMAISTRGVEIARYRLRKKLGLQTGQNLVKFILEY